MKTALVCIAKNEDLYLDEWLKYHFYIGFNDIYVYQNDWKFTSKKQYPHLCLCSIAGRQCQMKAYNHFLTYFSQKYDWVAILDCDEFLNLKDAYKNVEEFFNDYSDYFAVGVNWRIFGDSGLSFDRSNTSVLKRFIKCDSKMYTWIKTFLNLSRIRKYIPITRPNVFFPNPHCVNYAITSKNVPKKFTISVNKRSWCNKAYNTDLEDLTVQINHYHCKTREERELRVKHGRCDVSPSHPEFYYSPTDFDEYNRNDIEDRRLADIAIKNGW